jgi:hypothetical protein
MSIIPHPTGVFGAVQSAPGLSTPDVLVALAATES